MRILICDDDKLIIEKIRSFIQGYFDTIHLKCPEIAEFYSGEALLEDKGEKDILFLDVEMPGISGIEAGNRLKEVNKDIIIFIVTSYSEYLDDAMRFHVFRYLSKPLDEQRFIRNFSEAIDLYNKMATLIPVEDKQGIHTLPASQIIAVEAQGRKVIVHTLSGDIQSIQNIQYWTEKLPSNMFFQTHRSFIINFEHVNDFDHMLIHMAGGRVDAYLTRRKYSEFKERYLLYLESTR